MGISLALRGIAGRLCYLAMDSRYADYQVTRDVNGKLVVDTFNRDPRDDFWYDTIAFKWVAKGGSEGDDNLSLKHDDLLDTAPLGGASRDEEDEIIGDWEIAAAEYDRLTGGPGSSAGDYVSDDD